MASEITATVALAATKGYLIESVSTSVTADMTGTRSFSNVQAIGTSYEALVVNADITTSGWAYFRNLDTTNYIEIGVVVAATFYPLLKLKAGVPQLVHLSNGVLYAKANTAACDLKYVILEA